MRQFLVSFDGLGLSDIDSLLALLPQSRGVLGAAHQHRLHSGGLIGAQPIWAQILTGEPWYRNGCAGYSKPEDSLNSLHVVTEQDLLVPSMLLTSRTKEKPDVIVNVPIIQPAPGRVWLADGSLKTNVLVSPRRLIDKEPLKSYRSRPYPDAATTYGPTRQRVRDCLKTEMIRAECAQALFEQIDWNTFIWRVTIFDHLSHLFGTDLLSQPNLFFFEELKMLMTKIDTVLQAMCSLEPAVPWIILSAFSHMPCRSMLNLNSKLERGGFLRYERKEAGAASTALQRKAAIEAIARTEKIAGFELRSMEGKLDLRHTVAASPVSGCVFINRADHFADGIVNGAAYADTYRSVRGYLHESLSREFGSVVIGEIPEGMRMAPGVPDFVINVPGVELHNTEEQVTRAQDHPITTHCSTGFAILSKAFGSHSGDLNPTGITKLMST